MTADLRLGRYQDVMQDVTCDLLCFDAPYSERTHAKQRHGRREGSQWVPSQARWATSRGIGYDHWSAADVADFVSFWAPRTRGWMVSLTDSELYPEWRDSMRAAGRYVFAPLPCVQIGMNVRLAGDGPSNWSCWAVVSRPKSLHKWRTLPGAYVGNPFDPGENTATSSRHSGVVGSKPVWLMRALIRDYSNPGDVVADPTAGGGTTLLAALQEGRAAIGAEAMPEHYDIARKRLERGYTAPLPFTEQRPAPEQTAMFAEEE